MKVFLHRRPSRSSLGHRLRASESGNALIELAFSLPLFLLLILGTAELANLAWASVQINSASRAAAAYASASRANAACSNILLVAQAEAPSLVITLTIRSHSAGLLLRYRRHCRPSGKRLHQHPSPFLRLARRHCRSSESAGHRHPIRPLPLAARYLHPPRPGHHGSRAMTTRPLHPIHPSEHGSIVIEFALSVVLLAILIFGCIGVAMAFYTYQVVNEYARDASRYAMVHGAGCNSPITGNCSIGAGGETQAPLPARSFPRPTSTTRSSCHQWRQSPADHSLRPGSWRERLQRRRLQRRGRSSHRRHRLPPPLQHPLHPLPPRHHARHLHHGYLPVVVPSLKGTAFRPSPSALRENHVSPAKTGSPTPTRPAPRRPSRRLLQKLSV